MQNLCYPFGKQGLISRRIERCAERMHQINCLNKYSQVLHSKWRSPVATWLAHHSRSEDGEKCVDLRVTNTVQTVPSQFVESRAAAIAFAVTYFALFIQRRWMYEMFGWLTKVMWRKCHHELCIFVPRSSVVIVPTGILAVFRCWLCFFFHPPNTCTKFPTAPWGDADGL